MQGFAKRLHSDFSIFLFELWDECRRSETVRRLCEATCRRLGSYGDRSERLCEETLRRDRAKLRKFHEKGARVRARTVQSDFSVVGAMVFDPWVRARAVQSVFSVLGAILFDACAQFPSLKAVLLKKYAVRALPPARSKV